MVEAVMSLGFVVLITAVCFVVKSRGIAAPLQRLISDGENKAEVTSESVEKKIAVVRCQGGERAKDRFVYRGVSSCQGSMAMAVGHKQCAVGCLGLGDCINVCPTAALSMDSHGVPVVNDQACNGCGNCVRICPKNIIVLDKAVCKHFVGCCTHDKGPHVRNICAVGCIACGLCKKNCSFDAITLHDSLAVIDGDLCTNCGACLTACPQHCIVFK